MNSALSQTVGGIVGVKAGVGVNVGVGVRPRMSRKAPPVGKDVSTLSPFETRASQRMDACPVCRAVTLKVKTAPLVVALLPCVPAMARMNVPGCGTLMAATASTPKRFPIVILLVSTSAGSK